MTYEQLLKNVPFTGAVPQGVATLVAQDSRRVVPGAVYVCIKGRTHDGHAYAPAALEAGAGMVVSERPLGLPGEVVVPDARFALAEICSNFFGRPADKLTLVGVTGTNGKTTVAYILRQILEACGKPCGLIGTAGSEVGGMHIPARFTTPEAFDLHALLARMVAAGCGHAVMEASSQALDQGRLMGLDFALAIFTNLSRDHLDYHTDMERYFAAKNLLVQQSRQLLANLDDEWGARLLRQQGEKVARGYSMNGTDADYMARNTELTAGGVRFGFLGNGFLVPVRFAMPGAYSVSNALAAASAAVMLGCEPDAAATALGASRGVPGRCEVLYNGAFTVLCDFAHTPAALENLLAALRPLAAGRLVVLFGCPGQRDREKRPQMAAAVAAYADSVILTSDNPRSEPESQILLDALPVLQSSGLPLLVEPDRERAVCLALEGLQPRDTLVLCGKGHEDYQVLDGRTVYLSESRIVRQWLARQGAGDAE